MPPDKQVNEKIWDAMRPLIGETKALYGPPTNIFQMVYRGQSAVAQEIQNAFGSSIPVISPMTLPLSDSDL